MTEVTTAAEYHDGIVPDGRPGPHPDAARPMPLSRALGDMGLLLAVYLLVHVVMDLLLALTPNWRPFLSTSPFFLHFFRALVIGSGRGLDFIVLTGIFLASWIVAFAYGRWRRNMSFPACFGLFILLYYFARQFYLFLPELQTVADTGSVAPAIPAAVFYRTVIVKSFREVVLPLLGLALLYGAFPGLQARTSQIGPRAKAIAAKFRLGIRKDPVVDTMHGLWTFFVVLIGAVIVNFFATRYFSTGDESQVFTQVTPDLVVLISLAAGLGEELVFRGILLTGLLLAFRVVSFRRPRDILLTTAAIFIQAVFFGLVHAGYGSLAHIITPFFFGVIAAIIFLRFGFLAVVIVHFLIDIAALGAPLAAANMWTDFLFTAFLFSTLIVPAIFFLYRAITWLEEQGRLMGEVVAS